MLDTCAIRKDYYFKRNSLVSAFTYLDRVGHKIILPQVVVDELIENYKKDLQEYNRQLSSLSISAQKLEINNKLSILDIDKSVDEYKSFLDSEIKKRKIIIVKANSKYFEKILNKAVKKNPPFKKDKESDPGFKDAVIWESVVDVLKEGKYLPLAFITDNKSDFSDPLDKEALNPELKKEVSGTEFNYFLGLGAFLEKFGIPLINAVTKEGISNAISEYILKNITEDQLEAYFVYCTPHVVFSVTKDSLSLEIDHHYVYKADTLNYHVQANGSMGIWAVVYDPISDEYYGEYFNAPFTALLKINKREKTITIDDFYTESEDVYIE